MPERNSFIGPQIPQEVKMMARKIQKLEKPSFRKIVQGVVALMEGSDSTSEEAFLQLQKQVNIADFDIIYSGLYSLLRAAFRIPLSSMKQEVLKEDLIEIGIPAEFSSDLATVVFGSKREKIDEFSALSGPSLPTLENVRWRVDVTISTSHLNRVLEPSVLMELNLTDESMHTFEVPVTEFHKLRHDVAYLLREMEELEKKNIFKIQDK